MLVISLAGEMVWNRSQEIIWAVKYGTILHRHRPISLSGKRVCDSPSIQVSEISVYYENRWVVPMLGKDLFTLHFAKAWKFSIVAQQITWRHNRNSNESQIITCSVENYVGITQWFVNSKKGSSLQITLKLRRNHDLNDCARMDISLIRLCPRPSNPNTVWKLRLSAFCMCSYFLVSYWWVR